MARVRFLMVGGFLGAGKTTAIAKLASHYLQQGRKVGLVTNDQAFDLVDTMSLRAQGFDVGEVPGACFCCKFDDLVETVAGLTASQSPDIVITEPVGSCTDLVATVIEPLRHLHGDQYDIAPLAVLLKPEHGKKILGDESRFRVFTKAAYIFLKQLEEADTIVINKSDKLTDEKPRTAHQPDRRSISQAVPLFFIVRKTGEGFDELVSNLDQPRPATTEFMEVDYDIYAEGEAELGWLNATFDLVSQGDPLSMDTVCRQVVEACHKALLAQSLEPAHLKSGWPNQTAARHSRISLGRMSKSKTPCSASAAASTIRLTVNARVAADPDQLSVIVNKVIDELSSQLGMTANAGNHQSFRPGRPTPTHRMGASE